MTKTLIGLVTDRTPTTLEYGGYRGWVRLNAQTGEWLDNITDEERRSLTLGRAVYSEEYDDLRPEMTQLENITTTWPAGATGIHWLDTDWTECRAVIEHPRYGGGGPFQPLGPFTWVADPALTGDSNCTCDSCREP